jgi:hypothetical protein
MCGPSAAQTTIQQDQINLLQNISNQNSTVFGESQGILNNLNKTFAPILAAGPNQPGFSQPELTSMNTQATEGTAGNYATAQKNLQENQDAEGGGNNFLPSGVNQTQRANLASAGAAEQSQQQQQIVQANYATGRQNFNNAAGVLGQTASTLNPTGTANAAVGAGSAAASTADTIQQQSTSAWTSVLGALGGVASAAVGGMGRGGGGSTGSVASGSPDQDDVTGMLGGFG